MPATHRRTPLAELTRTIVSPPTASYAEHRVAAEIRAFADARGLAYREDEFGNAYVEYHRGRRRPPLVLGAHTDHPGFVVTAVRGRRLTLEFRGGISADYGRGEPLRIYSPSPGGKPRERRPGRSHLGRRSCPRARRSEAHRDGPRDACCGRDRRGRRSSAVGRADLLDPRRHRARSAVRRSDRRRLCPRDDRSALGEPQRMDTSSGSSRAPRRWASVGRRL